MKTELMLPTGENVPLKDMIFTLINFEIGERKIE